MIQIPRINRIEPQATPETPKVNLQTFNPAEVGRAPMEAVGDIASDYMKQYEKARKDTADTKATELANMYERERADKLTQLTKLEGDPTNYYESFESEGRERIAQIIESNPDMDEVTRAAAVSKLNQVDQRYYLKGVNSFYTQNAKYIKQTTDDRVKLLQSQFIDDAGTIAIDEEAGLKSLQASIGAIVNERYKQAEKLDIPKDSLLVDVAQDVSTGLSSVVQSLNAANRPDLAEKVMTKFGSFIDVKTMPKLLEQTDKEKQTVEAYNLLNKARNENPGDPVAFITANTKDEQVREKAIKLYNSDQAQAEQIKKRQSTQNYNQLFSYIFQKQNSAEPFVDVTAMEEDSMFKQLYPNISDPKQMKDIYKIIKPPNESDPDAVNQMFDYIRTGQISQLSNEELVQLTNNLSKADRSTVMSIYKDAYSDTKGNQRAEISQAYNNLDRIISVTPGIVKRKAGKNEYTDESKRNKAELQKRLLGQVNSLPAGASPAEINALAQKVVTDYVEEKGLNKPQESGWMKMFKSITNPFGVNNNNMTPLKQPTAPPKTLPTTAAPIKVATPPASVSNEMSNWTSKQWIQQFKMENPNVPVSEAAVRAFKDKKLGK